MGVLLKTVRCVPVYVVVVLLLCGCGGSDSSGGKTAGTDWYKDSDNDGYSDGTLTVSVTQPEGYGSADTLSALHGDCDDLNAGVNPAAEEIADDEIDQNCNGSDLVTWYKDTDGDGYSDGLTELSESRPGGYYTDSELIGVSGDCDDEDASECFQVTETPLGAIVKYRFQVSGVPYNTNDYVHQLCSTGGTAKFFYVRSRIDEPGVVWQDQDTGDIIYTIFRNQLKEQVSFTLPNDESDSLLAGVTYDSSSIYYLTIDTGDGTDDNSSRRAVLSKYNQISQTIEKRVLDTSKTGLDIVSFRGNSLNLRASGQMLGMITGRIRHANDSGIHYQDGISVTFDSSTLGITKINGVTSSHSQDNYLIKSYDGVNFIGMDLGDNFPRGINLHRFNQADKYSAVVYTFKTRHATTAGSPGVPDDPDWDNNTREIFEEISQSGTTYYQWSNDTRTYTGLAGIIELSGSLMVLFTGEPAPDGTSLDNIRVGACQNDARNIGFVTVAGDYENTIGCEVPDSIILSGDVTETGGYYDYQGGWIPQRNSGVVWLTDYTDADAENASHVKSLKLRENRVVLLWEKWTRNEYLSTMAMIIDNSGTIVSGPVDLGQDVRLNSKAQVWGENGNLCFVTGTGTMLEYYVFDIADGIVSPVK